jgi:hypothetical protein
MPSKRNGILDNEDTAHERRDRARQTANSRLTIYRG